MNDLLSITDASRLASSFLKKKVTNANITYLIQYGIIERVLCKNQTFIRKQALISYYENQYNLRKEAWAKYGEDVNWKLSFQHLKEAETTKHVHRLHPYKGKFIPQLVEYFLDAQTDAFKKHLYFRPNEVILDPFCGSGTTLVQSNEMGIHAVGIDVSAFNALISNVKVHKYDLYKIIQALNQITNKLKTFVSGSKTIAFDEELKTVLSNFNSKHFPAYEYRRQLRKGEIDEDAFGAQKLREFLPTYEKLVEKYDIHIDASGEEGFMDRWYLKPIRQEMDLLFNEICLQKDEDVKRVLSVILSRTGRSCRATTHADLSTLKKPTKKVYYCAKHGKICKPLFSMLRWWRYYGRDTIQRLQQFATQRTDTYQYCLQGDSRTIDIISSLKKINPSMANLVDQQQIKGIFTSPPYVGLIDYHEQHAYAYELFSYDRNDELEIGPLYKGQGQSARDAYVKGVAEVLNNCKKVLAADYNVFLVANDKYGLYPLIAERVGMSIVHEYKRPVLNRSERGNSAYSESIFHLKEK